MTDEDLEALLSRSTSLAPDAAVFALAKSEEAAACHRKNNSYKAVVES